MKAIAFKEQTRVYGENQKDYVPLPAYIDEADGRGRAISCWELSFKDKLKVFFTSKIWVSLYTFHKSIQPQSLTTDYPFTKNKCRK